ncbi:hypothetical protein PR048_013155 [Dryococelus australis]|uniref:Transposase n=1 Tax=Dryococelus australis TaxID=614101 RepID=A0ABQ9HS84_9NEOP|nr:hypothetical protein PR048_013155 [Dryococelus australis]
MLYEQSSRMGLRRGGGGGSVMKRHCVVVSQRTSKNVSYARATNDEDVINMFFENLECELDGVPPHNIWNFDETNLVDDLGSKKVITRRGTKYPEQIRIASKACTSGMVFGNAAGEVVPLYINYKAEKLWRTWAENGPDGARFNRTKSGGFDQQSFEDCSHINLEVDIPPIPPSRKSTPEVVEPDDEDESDSSKAFSLHDSDSSLNLSEDEASSLNSPA